MDVKDVQTSQSAQGDATLSTDSVKPLVLVKKVTATFLTAAFMGSALGELVLGTVTPDTMQQTQEESTWATSSSDDPT